MPKYIYIRKHHNRSRNISGVANISEILLDGDVESVRALDFAGGMCR